MCSWWCASTPASATPKAPRWPTWCSQALPELPEHIHLVAAGDPVNTYDLVEIADLGLVYTTTVGMEMAMSGVPVIVAGQTHYRGEGLHPGPGFLAGVSRHPGAGRWLPRSKQRMTQEQVERAWNYAYRFFFEYPHPFPWHLLRHLG